VQLRPPETELLVRVALASLEMLQRPLLAAQSSQDVNQVRAPGRPTDRSRAPVGRVGGLHRRVVFASGAVLAVSSGCSHACVAMCARAWGGGGGGGGCDQVLKRGMSQLFDVRKLLEKAANPKWEITSAHRARVRQTLIEEQEHVDVNRKTSKAKAENRRIVTNASNLLAAKYLKVGWRDPFDVAHEGEREPGQPEDERVLRASAQSTLGQRCVVRLLNGDLYSGTLFLTTARITFLAAAPSAAPKKPPLFLDCALCNIQASSVQPAVRLANGLELKAPTLKVVCKDARRLYFIVHEDLMNLLQLLNDEAAAGQEEEEESPLPPLGSPQVDGAESGGESSSRSRGTPRGARPDVEKSKRALQTNLRQSLRQPRGKGMFGSVFSGGGEDPADLSTPAEEVSLRGFCQGLEITRKKQTVSGGFPLNASPSDCKWVGQGRYDYEYSRHDYDAMAEFTRQGVFEALSEDPSNKGEPLWRATPLNEDFQVRDEAATRSRAARETANTLARPTDKTLRFSLPPAPPLSSARGNVPPRADRAPAGDGGGAEGGGEVSLQATAACALVVRRPHLRRTRRAQGRGGAPSASVRRHRALCPASGGHPGQEVPRGREAVQADRRGPPHPERAQAARAGRRAPLRQRAGQPPAQGRLRGRLTLRGRQHRRRARPRSSGAALSQHRQHPRDEGLDQQDARSLHREKQARAQLTHTRSPAQLTNTPRATLSLPQEDEDRPVNKEVTRAEVHSTSWLTHVGRVLGGVRRIVEVKQHCPTPPADTGAGGDHGIAKMWNRREISASFYDDPSHYLHPHPYAHLLPAAGGRRRPGERCVLICPTVPACTNTDASERIIAGDTERALVDRALLRRLGPHGTAVRWRRAVPRPLLPYLRGLSGGGSARVALLR
jgi:hypothetical protein